MEIHFVTGKGGVGKSAWAAAMAWSIARTGKRTLLVELGDQSFFQDYLSLPAVEYDPHLYQDAFQVSLWSGPSCLREYALHLLKVKSLYKLFFENPVTRNLVEVAPALPELAILGKITSGPPRNVGPKLPFDALVIDAFASGHFLALLKAPFGMAEAIRFGPMGEQSRGIIDVLKDPRISRYHIVGLPEELPVQESMELARGIRDTIGQECSMWLNKWVDYPAKMNADGPAYEREFILRRENQAQALKTLEKAFPGRVRTIPFFFETDEHELIRLMAGSASA